MNRRAPRQLPARERGLPIIALPQIAWEKGVRDQPLLGHLIESIMRELASARHEQSLRAKTPFAAAARMLLEKLGRGER